MDGSRNDVIEALEKARLIISSHGLASHLAGYNKDALARPVGDTTALRCSFLLNPNEPAYTDGNCEASLVIAYDASRFNHEGGVYDKYKRSVYVRLNSMTLITETTRLRENMVSALMMLCEMIETVLPQEITTVVMTPEEVQNKMEREKEQITARRIHKYIGKACIKNLRVWGKVRTSRLDDGFATAWGSMPEEQAYRYTESRVDRHGRVKYNREYFFSVMKTSSNEYYVTVRRTK